MGSASDNAQCPFTKPQSQFRDLIQPGTNAKCVCLNALRVPTISNVLYVQTIMCSTRAVALLSVLLRCTRIMVFVRDALPHV